MSRVAKAIRDIIANAVLKGLRDVPRGPVTITRVDVTRDFKQAKVFVSIFVPDTKTGREAEDFIDAILFAFEDSTHELNQMVNKQLRLKHTPVFEFVLDTGLEKMARVTEILDGVRPKTAGVGNSQVAKSDDQDDQDDE